MAALAAYAPGKICWCSHAAPLEANFAAAYQGGSRTVWLNSTSVRLRIVVCGCSLGRVLQDDTSGVPAAVPGLYTVGWVKRGPTGIIGEKVLPQYTWLAYLLGAVLTIWPCLLYCKQGKLVLEVLQLLPML